MDQDKEPIIRALDEGIVAAWNALESDGENVFRDRQTLAYAALASLELAGFTVVRQTQ